MATFNNLNVNESAKLQQLTIGDSTGNFANKFLDVSSESFTFYRKKDSTSTKLLQLVQEKNDTNEKGSLSSSANTVSFVADESVTLQGNNNNKLTLSGTSAVLEGNTNNKLTLGGTSAVLQGGGESLTLDNSGIEATNLSIPSGHLQSSNQTTLGGTINVSDGSNVYYGGTAQDNKMTLDLTGNKFTSKSVAFELQKKLDVKQSEGSVSLLEAKQSNDTGAAVNTLTVNASTTFKNTDEEELMTLSGSAVTVPADATFNSEKTTNLSGTTTLKDSAGNELLKASGTTVVIGNAAKFTSPHETALDNKTTVTGDLNLGQEGAPATVVLGGLGSSLTAKDGATINFSDAAFELQNGGTFTVSGENFLSVNGAGEYANATENEIKNAKVDTRLLRHVGLQLEELVDGTGRYLVVRDPSRPFYTDSANTNSTQNVAFVRDRDTTSTGALQFEYNNATYEEKGLTEFFLPGVQEKHDTVEIYNTNLTPEIVDRLVKKPDEEHLVLQKTADNIITLFQEQFYMKSIDRGDFPGKVLSHNSLNNHLDTLGESKFVYSNLGVKEVDSGLDVWFENADKSKFIVHNYLTNSNTKSSEWFMLQLVRGSGSGTDFVNINDSQKNDPVNWLLSMTNGSSPGDDDLSTRKARVLVTRLTDGTTSTQGVRHITLADDATSLQSAGDHAMLCVGVNNVTVPTNHMLKLMYEGKEQWYHRFDVSKSESQAIAEYARERDESNKNYKDKIQSRVTKNSSDTNSFIYVRFTSTDMELLVLERRVDQYGNTGWWHRRSGWTRTKVPMNAIPPFKDEEEIVKNVWTTQNFYDIDFLTENEYHLNPIKEYQQLYTDNNNLPTGYIVSGDRVQMPSRADDEDWVKLNNEIIDIANTTETLESTENPQVLNMVESDGATYHWISNPSENITPAYISRQQDKCFIAAVVPEPALRSDTVTPEYYFFGDTIIEGNDGIVAQGHAYLVGSSKHYADASTIQSVTNVKGLANAQYVVGGSTQVILSHVDQQPLKPLVLAGTGDNWRVATIEHADSVDDQKVYIDYNSQNAPFRWIFPGYTTDAPGWYKFEDLDVGSTEYRYGSESFWQRVKDNQSKLVAIAGLEGESNYVEADFGDPSTTDSGPHQLLTYNSAVGANKLFSTNTGQGDKVGNVFTRVYPLKEGTWKQFTFSLSIDGTDIKVLKHGYVEYEYIAINPTHNLTGDNDADIGALEGGDTVTATPAPDTSGSVITYTFWALGGGGADVQEMKVRNTLTVDGTSNLNHVDCNSIFVRSKNFAVGVSGDQGSGTTSDDNVTAALKVDADFNTDSNGTKYLISATTTVKGSLAVTPIETNNTDHFKVKEESGLELNYKGKLEINGVGGKTKISETGSIGDYKFGSLAAKKDTGDKGGSDTVTIGTDNSKRLQYNLHDNNNTATSTGLTHTWDSFMKYDTSTPTFTVGGMGNANNVSVHVKNGTTSIGHEALVVPDSDNISITRDTDVKGVKLKVESSTNGPSVELGGDTNTFKGGVTTFGTETHGKLVINNDSSTTEGNTDAHSITSTLPLTTTKNVTMKTTVEGAPEVINVALTEDALALRNDTVTIEGGSGAQNIVVNSTKTAFYKNLEVYNGTNKFFDIDVSNKKKLSLTNDAELNMITGTKLNSNAILNIQAGGTGNWFNLESDSTTFNVGNLTVSGDGALGEVKIAGGGKLTINDNTKLDIQSGDSNWLTVTTTNATGGNTFQAGTLQSTSAGGVNISNDALAVPLAGDITITRNVDMRTKKLTVNDFEVMGTMTTKHAEEVQIGDSNMLLNAFHGLDSDQDAGIVVKCKRINNTVTATAIGTAGNLTVDDASVNDAAKFTDGDILSVVAVDSAVDPADSSRTIFIPVAHDDNGLYVCNGVTSTQIKLKDEPGLSFCKPQKSRTERLDRQFHVYKVMVHHLKFHMVADHDEPGDAMSAGGTVSYGHGSTVQHFEGHYGYRDMMMGDIHSSVVKNEQENTVLTAAITKTTKNVQLPTGVEGATYRVINTNTNDTGVITVSSSDDDTQTFTLNAEGHSRYTYINDINGTSGKWYEQF